MRKTCRKKHNIFSSVGLITTSNKIHLLRWSLATQNCAKHLLPRKSKLNFRKHISDMFLIGTVRCSIPTPSRRYAIPTSLIWDIGTRCLFSYFLQCLVSTEVFRSLDPECDICIDFDTNEYPNIFVSRKRYKRISEYICIKEMIQMNIRIENDMNIRHTLTE